MNLHFNFTYGVVTRHFAGIKFIHNARFYKMMVLNLLRVTKNDNMILLQNEDWFLIHSSMHSWISL